MIADRRSRMSLLLVAAEVLLPAGHTVIYKVLAITHSKV